AERWGGCGRVSVAPAIPLGALRTGIGGGENAQAPRGLPCRNEVEVRARRQLPLAPRPTRPATTEVKRHRKAGGLASWYAGATKFLKGGGSGAKPVNVESIP